MSKKREGKPLTRVVVTYAPKCHCSSTHSSDTHITALTHLQTPRCYDTGKKRRRRQTGVFEESPSCAQCSPLALSYFEQRRVFISAKLIRCRRQG